MRRNWFDQICPHGCVSLDYLWGRGFSQRGNWGRWQMSLLSSKDPRQSVVRILSQNRCDRNDRLPMKELFAVRGTFVPDANRSEQCETSMWDNNSDPILRREKFFDVPSAVSGELPPVCFPARRNHNIGC